MANLSGVLNRTRRRPTPMANTIATIQLTPITHALTQQPEPGPPTANRLEQIIEYPRTFT